MSNSTQQRHKKSFISMGTAGAMAIIAFNFCNQSEVIRSKIGESNLVQYAVLCAAFLSVYLVINIILGVKLFDNSRFLDIMSAFVCVGMAGFMYICWKQDVNVYYSPAKTYLWHIYPTWIILVILVLITVLYEATAVNIDLSKGKLRYCIFIYYGMVIGISGYLNYFLDYLSVDCFHGSAVFNSVYNVMHGIPYEEISNTVYGNYALLLVLPMKILGNGEYFDLSRIMCLLTMVCVALGIYVIHNLIKRQDIRILCVTALLWVHIFRKTNYWQLNPMRILWPMILLAWMVFLDKKGKNTEKVCKYAIYGITYMILTLSIVWNKESGIVCLIGYLVFSFSKGLSASFVKAESKVWGAMVECFVMLTTVFAAFIMVGVYNLFVAGKWITWRVFFFPLFTKEYVIDQLMLSLQKGIWTWMAVAFLFLGVVCKLGIKILRREEIEPEEHIYAAAATIGLGLMTYFINRAAYMNLTICYYEAVICIGGVVCSMERKDYGVIISEFMKSTSVMVLVALVAGEMLHLETALYNDRGASRQQILNLRDKVREDAEANTYAFGINIPELYSLLGWETRSYTTDWADVFITRDIILDKIYHDLESEDCIITDRKTFERYEDVAEYVNERFYIDRTYPFNDDVEFYLMKRK